MLLGAVLNCTDPARGWASRTRRLREAELRAALHTADALPDGPTVLDEFPPDTRRAVLAGFAAGVANKDLSSMTIVRAGRAGSTLVGGTRRRQGRSPRSIAPATGCGRL